MAYGASQLPTDEQARPSAVTVEGDAPRPRDRRLGPTGDEDLAAAEQTAAAITATDIRREIGAV